jgi:hypothetical protein
VRWFDTALNKAQRAPERFEPVAKQFQKRQYMLTLVTAPRRGRAGDARYTFSPTIQLTSFPAHTNNSFFEIDAASVFQTLTPKHFSSETRAMLLRDSRTENISRTREHLTVSRDTSSTQSTKIVELLSSLFSTLSSTVREVTRAEVKERGLSAKSKSAETFFSSVFASLQGNTLTTNLRNQFTSAVHRNQFANTSQRNQFANAFQSLIFPRDSRHTTNSTNTIFNGASSTSQVVKTTPLHLQMDQWLAMPRKGTRVDGEFRAAPNVVTTLALDFAAPKAAEAELVHQRIAQFVSSPALTYAKRQQAMSEGVIQALRALQTPKEEPKKVAPPPQLPTIEQITNQVKMQLERDLRIERERRGL